MHYLQKVESLLCFKKNNSTTLCPFRRVKLRSSLVENVGRKKWKRKKKQLLVLFVSLNVCLESEFFSTKVSKDPSRNAWDPCPAELKNRLCMKCNPPALCGIWQVFTATLIQEYLVLSVLSSTHLSPWHTVTYRLHTLHWQAPGNCLQTASDVLYPP